ncbi:BrnA antitoxin of type II toxin-antitoxin system [Shimia isoporae]|uniref:BrnA antitoxin of type II toxin-antitoxin system n=1 Tax=Shimia isoporae TaxID=647720 RepID=A0A4R1NT49_9RHOB|nr:BrnA antitoxin family protein [Shimia isoporae]TCL08448.1 BrnA antitoxin of type II toxin-antitoxin system [Shimia isoporae]
MPVAQAGRKPQTKTQRIARAKLARNMLLLNSESWLPVALREDIPEAWHTLELDLDVEEPKEKVTLYLDRSVARFYRAMGRGYHARINRLLATWAQMKIADEVQVEKALSRR